MIITVYMMRQLMNIFCITLHPDVFLKYEKNRVETKQSKIVFYDKDVVSSDDIMCWTWLHSSICGIEKYIKLSKDEVDGAVKDKKSKKFDKNFAVEFLFDTANFSIII